VIHLQNFAHNASRWATDWTLCKAVVSSSSVNSFVILPQTLLFLALGRDSSVGAANGYGMDGPGIESRWTRDFPNLSRSALGTTQLPVQWVPGLSRGVNYGRGLTLTPHPLLVPWSWKSRVIPVLPLWAVQPVQSLSACTRETFTFHLLFLSLTAAATSLTQHQKH
jgi:hypothetical protein